MLAILGFVAAVVYVYSLGYMADDPGKRRFFVYLDLFVASMALLVLAGNLAVLLIGWTGVGISSFLLISFWRDRPGTLSAGLQALAANAVGRDRETDLRSVDTGDRNAKQLTCAITCPLSEESTRFQARVLLTATTVRSAMIQPASLFAYTETLTTGNAAFVRPFFTISPLNGPIARS